MAIDKTKSKQVLINFPLVLFNDIMESNIASNNNKSEKVRQLIGLGLSTESSFDIDAIKIPADTEYKKFLLTIPLATLEKIKTFQHKNQLDNRTIAIFSLILIGLSKISK